MQVHFQFLVFLLLSITPASLSGDVYTALASMKGLVRLEGYLLDLLDRYIENHPEPHEDLPRFAKEAREMRHNAMDDIEVFLGHPVNAFLLLRRFTKHWQEVDKFLDDRRKQGK